MLPAGAHPRPPCAGLCCVCLRQCWGPALSLRRQWCWGEKGPLSHTVPPARPWSSQYCSHPEKLPAAVSSACGANGSTRFFPFRERRRVISKYSFLPIKTLPSELITNRGTSLCVCVLLKTPGSCPGCSHEGSALRRWDVKSKLTWMPGTRGCWGTRCFWGDPQHPEKHPAPVDGASVLHLALPHSGMTSHRAVDTWLCPSTALSGTGSTGNAHLLPGAQGGTRQAEGQLLQHK